MTRTEIEDNVALREAADLHHADVLGPAKVVHVCEPSAGLRAVLVIDNLARGPSVGGLRMAPDVSVDECRRLARAMTLKTLLRASRTAEANPSFRGIRACRPIGRSG